ncbi:MAG: hypothetical protein ACYTGN_15475 [Planctomycetota bacterium]
MKHLAVLLFAAVALGQGRDAGKGKNAVIFVQWTRSVENDAIHRTAWRALEPHNVSRRRLASFDANREKAEAYLAANHDAGIVVAYDAESARRVRAAMPNAAVLEVHEGKTAHVRTRVNPERFERVLKYLGEDAARLKRVGSDDPLPGPDAIVASTTGRMPEGRAVVTMRPDPTSLGLAVAAQVLHNVRSKRPFKVATVRRMRLTVDIEAAHRAGIHLPLRLFARANVVRRAR